MTDPPQGRDQSPAVAALAVRVDGLRRRIETLATSIDDLTSTQQEHATVLDGIAELRRQVEQILTILGNDDEPSPGEWFWLTMTGQQRDERLSELSDWVETVLRTQYPGYLAGQIRPCWPNHPEATMGTHLALPALDPRLPHQPASTRKTPPTGTTAGPPASPAASARSCAAAKKPASPAQPGPAQKSSARRNAELRSTRIKISDQSEKDSAPRALKTQRDFSPNRKSTFRDEDGSG